MSRENNVLKRMSCLSMPLIPELPEDAAALTSDPGMEQTVDCKDVRPLLESQAKIAGQRKMLFTLSKIAARAVALKMSQTKEEEKYCGLTHAGCKISIIVLAELS